MTENTKDGTLIASLHAKRQRKAYFMGKIGTKFYSMEKCEFEIKSTFVHMFRSYLLQALNSFDYCLFVNAVNFNAVNFLVAT